MQYFRYGADRIPVLIIISLFLLDVAVFFLFSSPLLVVGWMALGLFPKACICSWNHHHQHLPTFRSIVLNRLLEVVYTFHTGITTNVWVLHHVLGHHVNYLDQEKDESRWQASSGRTMGVLEYVWHLATTGYQRAWTVGKEHPRYQSDLLRVGVLSLAVLAVFFYVNWFNALVLFAVPMVLGYIFTCWHTYYHHTGLDTSDHHEASYNIMDRWYNLATGNLGFHTAHHMKPGLHWSRLPEYHAQIADKIPEHLYVEPCPPFKWINRFTKNKRAAVHPASIFS